MNEEELQAIEARASAATPGPWHYIQTGEKSNDWMLGAGIYYGSDEPPATGLLDVYDEEGNEVGTLVEDVCYSEMGGAGNYNDALFIAHARTDIPALITEVRELQAAVGTLEDALSGSVSLVQMLQKVIYSDIPDRSKVQNVRLILEQVQ